MILNEDELLSEGDGLMSATNKNKINSFIFIPRRSLTYKIKRVDKLMS